MVIHAFLYKQNVHKQRQAEIGKKIKQKLSNTETELLLFENYFSFFIHVIIKR